MFFDYLNGWFINVLLIIMAKLLVTKYQKIVSHSNGFLFQLKCLICGTESKVTLLLYFIF